MTSDPKTTGSGRTSSMRHIARLGVAAGTIGVIVLAAATAQAATGRTGTHYVSTATCRPISSPVVAGQDVINVKAPTIYAANVTSGQDAQFVGFRQRMVKWNGSAWVNTGQASALYQGFATDSTAALDFKDPQGRTYRMPEFNLTAAKGYQAVVTDYYWYNSNTVTGSDAAYAWHSNNNPTSYCTFAY